MTNRKQALEQLRDKVKATENIKDARPWLLAILEALIAQEGE